MKIAIIDYKSGNTRSVQFALERIGVEGKVTQNFKEIERADKVIFPGVGAANAAMKMLQEKGLDELIKSLKQPVLGICLGMQLLCEHSEEGDTKGLSIFPQRVKRFAPSQQLKIPHMGWNSLTCNQVPLLEGLPRDSYAYFVHSFYAELNGYTIASCGYGNRFSAAIQKDNFYGTQFHPEKSGAIGQRILENFIKL